jgi:hypothetical protein
MSNLRDNCKRSIPRLTSCDLTQISVKRSASRAALAVAALTWLTAAAFAYASVCTWWTNFSSTGPAVRIILFITLSISARLVVLGTRDAVVERRFAASALLVGLGSFAALRVVGKWPFAWDALPSAPYAAFVSLAAFFTALGIAARWFWSRWVGMAFGLATCVSGGLNYAGWGFREWTESSWIAFLATSLGPVLFLQLAHPAVRIDFEANARHGLWTSPHLVIRVSRVATIGALVAIPMLLVFVWGHPFVAEARIPAALLALGLALGAVLVILQKSAGVAILGVVGIGLLFLAYATLQLAMPNDFGSACYFAAFWVPSGLSGIVAFSCAFTRTKRFTNR